MWLSGPAGFPAFVAVISVIFAVYPLYRIRRRPPLPGSAQAAVTGDGNIPPVGPGLDPRMPGRTGGPAGGAGARDSGR